MNSHIWIMTIVGFGIVFLFFFGAIDLNDTILHEDSHKQTAIYFGCEDPIVNITFFERSYFKCGKYRERPIEWAESEKFLHSMNEIVSYNNTSIFHSILTGSFLVVISIIFTGFLICQKIEQVKK